MGGKMLGLDIGHETITAVLVTGGPASYDIDDIKVVDIETAGGIDNALKELLGGEAAPESTCITSLPARYCSFRTVHLPFTGKQKILQAIPYELEPLLPYPVDDALIDILARDRTDRPIIFAAAVPTTYLTDLVRTLRENRCGALVIDIGAVPIALQLMPSVPPGEYRLLLDMETRDTTAIIFTNDAILHVRHYCRGNGDTPDGTGNGTDSPASAALFTSHRTILRNVSATLGILRLKGELDGNPGVIYLTGYGAADLKEKIEAFLSVPAEPVDISTIGAIRFTGDTAQRWNPPAMNRALALATRNTKKAAGFNFAVGPFEPEREYGIIKKNVKSAAALLIAIAVLLGTDLFMGYRNDRIHNDRLKNAIQSIFTETMPGAKIVDPLHQMRTAVDKMRKSENGPALPGSGPSVLDILNALSRKIPPSIDLLITNFTLDGDVIEIRGETDNFNTVDAIKTAFETSALFTNVKISSATVMKKENRVAFDVRMGKREAS
jgi:general secretion pathway protein L